MRNAEIVIIAVPTHARQQVLGAIAEDLAACTLLLSWEGTGPFREFLRTLAIDGPVCAGLQRSPIVARVRHYGLSCDLLGVRSAVVAAAVEPGASCRVQALLAALLPFRITLAPSFEYVSLSPGNPLIHPARLFSIARTGDAGDRDAAARFYANWDDDASNVLLAMHRELATVREALGLSKQFITTLADRREWLTPTRLSAEIRSEARLADVPVPSRMTSGHWNL